MLKKYNSKKYQQIRYFQDPLSTDLSDFFTDFSYGHLHILNS